MRISIFFFIVIIAMGGLGYAIFYPSVRGHQNSREMYALSRRYIQQIVQAEETYFSHHGEYISAEPHPAGYANGRTPVVWSPDEHHGFARLGWFPDTTKVFCRYGVNTESEAYTVEVECYDGVDTDRKFVYFGYVKPAPDSSKGIPGPFGRCSAKGVYAWKKNKACYVLATIGPCDSHSAKRGQVKSLAKNDTCN